MRRVVLGALVALAAVAVVASSPPEATASPNLVPLTVNEPAPTPSFEFATVQPMGFWRATKLADGSMRIVLDLAGEADLAERAGDVQGAERALSRRFVVTLIPNVRGSPAVESDTMRATFVYESSERSSSEAKP